MRTIDELKKVYLDVLQSVLEDNFDLATKIVNAITNGEQDEESNKILTSRCKDKLIRAMTLDEYVSLSPHIIEIAPEIAKLVLLRIKN